MMAYGLDCAFRYTDIYQVPVDRRCRDNGHLAVSLAKVMGHMHISLYDKENNLSNGTISWPLGQAKYYTEMADCTKIAIG